MPIASTDQDCLNDSVKPGTVKKRVETAIYGYVYCALTGDLAKIGITSDPDRRRRQLETASGRKLDGFESFHVYAPGAAERCLHARWDFLRTEGEWFTWGGLVYDDICSYMRTRQNRA